VYIAPSIAGATADGKLCLDVGWCRDLKFADVIGAVIAHVEAVLGGILGMKPRTRLSVTLMRFCRMPTQN
jgi:hypothetical protein